MMLHLKNCHNARNFIQPLPCNRGELLLANYALDVYEWKIRYFFIVR